MSVADKPLPITYGAINVADEEDIKPEAVIDNTNQDRIDPPEELEVPDEILEDHVEEILTHFGWDLSNPSIENTPRRFLKYLKEFHNPLNVKDVLGKPFESPDNAMVIQRQIPFRGVCEHHLLPMLGEAFVGYIPDGLVIGLSKMARLVDAVGTEKPSLQEHMCDKIADIMDKYLKPKGVMVVIDSLHTCMACRGVNVPNVPTTTSSTRGVFLNDHAARAEFTSLALRRA